VYIVFCCDVVNYGCHIARSMYISQCDVLLALLLIMDVIVHFIFDLLDVILLILCIEVNTMF